ncbi:L-threonylcarbamoyladenylate synthase [Mastigocoleus testarum]|uniref:L-threonylcarbamoyladenylate synthase n=1 Tax=Mastigocoleus testarum BC008 TaxID=371196 RepID=A0A0V7ZVQ0_9CYAN|nr:L-threonylcarbamoyladenylate synthase [Mastigocoleus testarum]KST67952.1 hypothetical protein BC008_31670 [Mastigocoleus testarum BC008]KST68423.1 hypothetical protein BC008_33455 [Mastigocoleus testarum BC008]
MPLVSFDLLVSGIRSGQLASFPTDTVPALATIPSSSSLIFNAKQRSLKKPLILMAANISQLWDYVSADFERDNWHQIAQNYWPGALTLVVPASQKIPASLNPTDPTTIGVRVPDSEIARKILVQTGPLATTSANLSGQPPLRRMAEIAATFPNVLTLSPQEVPLELEMGTGQPSTVAKWDGNNWKILREGSVILDT